tara:strand:+ start:4712 stop:5293 length:582 start_codon:yes stop_codon:yes gene_type:complete
MAKSISEVMLGTGELYIAAEATAFPTDPTTTPSSSDWTDIGYSESGWTLDYDKTFEDVMVAEEIDPVFTIKTAQEIRISGELAQVSLANLKEAMGGGTITTGSPSTGFSELKPPATDAFLEKSLLLRVDAPDSTLGGTLKKRDVLVPRAVNVGAFSMTHAKAPQKVLVAVEYKVLKPGSGAQFAELFRIVDEV